MADVCVIPCFRRPEFLYHCCDRISKARGADNIAYIFRLDYGYSKELLPVIHQFPFNKVIVRADRTRYSEGKQSHNVLSGFMTAAYVTEQLVFMIEEDVLIATDFFDWHRQVHAAHANLFCSLSTKNHNREQVPDGDIHEYYLTTGDYCSLGVCFKKDVLLEYIKPHHTHAYYSAMSTYCAKTFPNSRFGYGFSEQDGLIRRIQERLGMSAPIAYPCTPRAYHCGYYGKNRPRRTHIHDTELRMRSVGDIIFSKERMKVATGGGGYYNDSIPINLEINEPLKIKQV